jgi:hypothetical protein
MEKTSDNQKSHRLPEHLTSGLQMGKMVIIVVFASSFSVIHSFVMAKEPIETHWEENLHSCG